MTGTLLPRLATAAAAVLLAVAPARAQGAGQADLARRTFENAEQLLRDGKQEQAMRDYQQVVQSFPESEWADDALMRLGAHHYPPESLSALGGVEPAAQEASRPFFEQVRERYPQSDSAPQALYKLGLLSLEPSSPRRNLDEAYASFSRVVNIYPDSAWVGRAHLGAAFAELWKNEYDRAILAVERALEGTYGGAAESEAHFFMGIANARLGEFVRAAEAFQRSRDGDPEGAFAERALDWVTLIYRTRLLPASGRPPRFLYAASFVPRLPAGEDLRGDLDLAVSPQGSLQVADARRGAILTFSRSGDLVATEAFPEPHLVSFDAFGGRIVAGRGRMAIAGAEFAPMWVDGGRVRPVELVAGAWRSSTMQVWLLDGKEGALLRYDGDPQKPATVVTDKESGARMSVLAAGPTGRLHLLDTKQKAVVSLAERRLVPVGPGGSPGKIQDPLDLDVDLLGNIYVLDGRRRAVVVLDPDGNELAVISPAAGTAGAFETPSALAVGPGGEVYVHDERKRTILLFD